MILLFLLLFVVCVSALILKLGVDGLQRKISFWGVNFGAGDCPKCKTRVPGLRAPNSTRQALWGGWTCSNCGIEIDRNGTDITTSIDAERLPGQYEKEGSFVTPYDARGETPLERVFRDDN